MSKKFSVSLEIDNIGPHTKDLSIDFNHHVSSNRIAFYAPNGTGKSFISRTFRLASKDKEHVNCDDLLTLGQDSAKMSFGIHGETINKKLEIRLKRNDNLSINDSTDLIFHVFNSDYVEENIKANNFTPDGNIEGYILSKSQIESTEEKEKKEELESQINQINEKIDSEILLAKQELRDLGVRANTTEYKYLNKDELQSRRKDFSGKEPDSFDAVAEQLEKLANIPDDLKDIEYPTLEVDIKVIENIYSTLMTSYQSSVWDKEFVEQVKDNFEFIEKGVSLSRNSKRCPFCKQTFNEEALELLRDYRDFIDDKEGKLIKRLDEFKEIIRSIRNNIEAHFTQIRATISYVNDLQGIFPSLLNQQIKSREITSVEIEAFTILENNIVSKTNNLSTVYLDTESAVEIIKSLADEVRSIDEENSRTIKAINSTKNNTNEERLFLRKRLCETQFYRYQNELLTYFDEETKVQSKLNEINIKIKEKEKSVVGISRREKYYETLTNLLDHFFKGKYTLDKESFRFVFLENNIGEKASKILSDGEKNVVAFCLYIAETHLYVANQMDYDKLFFVIDDPISSMDFQYVYMITQTLREIKELFGINNHERVWIFTHNLEFYSLLVSNGIVQHSFAIEPGKIYQIDHHLLMPYESHLIDIVDVAREKKCPTHTTPNSIRHVLETISRFEFSRNKSLKEYISENETLRKNSCIYTICQDLSHGGLRKQPTYTDEMLRDACKTVKTFIGQKYNGQISAIKY